MLTLDIFYLCLLLLTTLEDFIAQEANLYGQHSLGSLVPLLSLAFRKALGENLRRQSWDIIPFLAALLVGSGCLYSSKEGHSLCGGPLFYRYTFPTIW